jgi:hypothetical protein
MTIVASSTPQPIADEFDRLMRRARLEVRDEWREPMLLEFSQMLAELDSIHAFVDSHEHRIDLRQVITSERVEK